MGAIEGLSSDEFRRGAVDLLSGRRPVGARWRRAATRNGGRGRPSDWHPAWTSADSDCSSRDGRPVRRRSERPELGFRITDPRASSIRGVMSRDPRVRAPSGGSASGAGRRATTSQPPAGFRPPRCPSERRTFAGGTEAARRARRSGSALRPVGDPRRARIPARRAAPRNRGAPDYDATGSIDDRDLSRPASDTARRRHVLRAGAEGSPPAERTPARERSLRGRRARPPRRRSARPGRSPDC